MLRIAKWMSIALGGVLIAALLGLGVYTHTENFRELARRKIIAAANGALRGKIAIAGIEGSVWGHLTLIDVRVSDNGEEIAWIPRLTINHTLLPLIFRQVRLFSVQAEQPRLRLRESESGKWNIVEAFEPAEPTEEREPSPWTIGLDSLELEQGDVAITTHEKKNYHLRNLDVRGSIELGADGMAVNLMRLSSGVQADGVPEARVHGALVYRTGGSTPALQARELTIETGTSRLGIAGELKDFKTLEGSARLTISALTPADAIKFVSGWPVKSPIRGSVQVHGPMNALGGDFSLALASGKIHGRFRGSLGGERPRYQAAAELEGIDLHQLLGREDASGVMSGTVKAAGDGFALSRMTAEANGHIDSTTVSAWQIGGVAFQARLENDVATVAGEIAGQLGRANWNGKIALGSEPRYRLTLAAEQLNVQKLSPRGKPVAGTLNFKALVDGAGLSLASVNARARLELLPSSVGEVKIDGGRISANIVNQRVRIAEGRLKAGDTALDVSGDLPLDVRQQGQIRYRARVGTLAPWLKLAGQNGSGSVQVNGSAKGNIFDIAASGRLAATSVRFGAGAVGRGAVEYDLRYRNQPAVLGGNLKFDLSDARGGVHFDRVSGVVAVLPKTPYAFNVEARARDDQKRVHSVTANIVYQPGNVTARFTRLMLSLPDGTWRLAQPATVAQQQHDFMVDHLTLRNGDRQLFVDGRFSLSGAQALRFAIDRLPVESIRDFYPLKADVSGLVSANGEVGGSAAAPQIGARLKLENPKIAGQSYAGLSGSLTYARQAATFTATLQQDQQHQLTADMAIPMHLSWADGWRARSAGSLTGRVKSSGLSMAFLNAFTGKSAQGIDGQLTVDAQFGGTLERPEVRGFARVQDGKAALDAIGIRLSGIIVDAGVDSRSVRIRQLSARAGDGELNGSGSIALDKFTPRTIDASVTAKNWPAVNTQQYRAVIAGTIKVSGAVKAPQLTGKVDVLSGEAHPDLAFLEHGSTPIKRDPTITVTSVNGAEKAATPAQTKPEPAGGGIVSAASMNLQVHIPNNFWVRHRNANIELSGDVRASQAPGAKPVITGVIKTVRGWIGLQGRRFDVTRGTVELTGGEKTNAVIDVEAQYRVTNYIVTATLSGTAVKPALALKSDPQLDQADILALLLFNKPISALAKGEQVSLAQNAMDITTGFAASSIGTAVAHALGLQNLGVDAGDIDFSGGQVRYSRYVAQNTFVSVGQDVTGATGQEASAEYQITPDLKVGVTTSTKGTNGIDIIWHKRY